MQKILILLLLCSSQMNYAQTLTKQKKDNKWGFVDTSGQIVIDYQYDNLFDFYGQIAVVQKNGFWGFINPQNATLQPFEFKKVEVLRTQNMIKAQKENLWYLFDLNGKALTKEGFTEVGRIFNGKMSVCKADKCGLMQVDGKFVIKPKYDEIFFSGSDMVRIKKGEKYGYKTEKGKKAVPLKYEAIDKFYGSRAKAKLNGKWGFIDKKGKKIVKFSFVYIGEYVYDQYLQDYYAPYVYGTQVGKISSWGAAVPFEYEEIADETKPLENDLILIRFGKDYGAVDAKGKIVVVPFYKNAFSFSEGVAAVSDGKKFGFINTEGKIIYPIVLDNAENMVNGKAKVIKDGQEIELTFNDFMRF